MDTALDELVGGGHDREGAEKARGFGWFAKRELRIWIEEEESGRRFAQNLGRSAEQISHYFGLRVTPSVSQ